jgi:predicted PurR-regulated permease PerM
MATSDGRLKAYRRTMAIIAVIATLILAIMIIRPFILSIIFAMVLAYLFYPVYKSLIRFMPRFLPRESCASLLTVLLVILIIVVPLTVITVVLTNEIRIGYNYLQGLVGMHDAGAPIFLDIPSLGIPFLDRLEVNLAQLRDPILNLVGQGLRWFQGVLIKIPNLVFSIFIIIFSLYFFLKNAKDIMRFIRNFFPLPKGRYRQIFQRFDDLSRGMINGQIVVGMIQGFLAWIGFVILGVPSPVLWAVLTAIISVIPLLGAALVWFPIAVYLFITGYIAGDLWWKGIALLAYGSLVISTVDNILKPKIIGDRARIHPLIIFFGILGGIQLFGIPGIILGPLVLTLLDVVLGIFREVV